MKKIFILISCIACFTSQQITWAYRNHGSHLLRPLSKGEKEPDIARFEDSAYAVGTIDDLRKGVSILVAYFSSKENYDPELPSFGNDRDIAITALRRTLEEIEKEQDLVRARSLVFEWAHKYLEGADRIGRLRKAIEKITGQKLPSPLLRHIMYLINSSTARMGIHQIMWESEYMRMMARYNLGLNAMVSDALEQLAEDFPQRNVNKEIEELEADISELEKKEADARAAILKSRTAGRKFQIARERLDVILTQKRVLEQRRHDLLTISYARQKLIAIRSFLPLKHFPERMIENIEPFPDNAVSSI